MLKKDDFVARIAVGKAPIPLSAVFRIWSPNSKSDVYAAVRNIAGDIKISLHETGECNAGFTAQFAKKEMDAVGAMGGSRHQSQWWRQTLVGTSIVTPLTFVIPASELRMWREAPIETEEVTWVEPPGQGRSIIISCIFSGQSLPDDEWPERRNGTHLIGAKLLPNGEKFWLLWQDCSIGPMEKGILSEANALIKRQKPVRLSRIKGDTPQASRYLIFKEYPSDRLLIVLDAAAL
ncbi:MAG: hypothetical protein MJA29_00460 [Candidatus Omnitrophica bacterium]|nr:hypothetical protein [Candidatus Omnitrophota bacterium]